MNSNHSLRRRLIALLMTVITAIALGQGFVSWRAARADADQLFDEHMQQIARSLQAGLGAGTGTLRAQGIVEDQGYDYLVQVWAADGRLLRYPSGVLLPELTVAGFSQVQANRMTYRVFAMQSPAYRIQVAQNLAVRQQRAGARALRALIPIAIAAPLLMGATAWVVGLSLAPLTRLRRQIAARRVSDLEPVDTTDLPQEIRPLVDELNLLFERLAQSFEAQSRFVADAAHELRTPLAALTLQLDALQRADTAAARERAQARLVTGMTRASRMVEQMLQLARVQAGTAPPGPARSVDLAELAREAVTEGQAAAQARGIDLGLAQAESGTLSGDAQALRVLIANLVDNAMNHCPAGGGVDLRVRRQHACGADPDRLELIVDDSGPGIAPTDRPRVFERFVRLPGTDTPGSGLGLSIVKSIADLHQAQVRLETAPERNGLRVRVSFPVERSA